MWCPEGFAEIYDVTLELQIQIEHLIMLGYMHKNNHAEDILTLTRRLEKWDGSVFHFPKQITSTWMLEAGDAETITEAELCFDILFAWCLTQILERFPPTLGTIEGGLIKIDGLFYWHVDQLEICYLDWPISQQAEFLSYMQYHREGHFTGDDVLERFAFLDLNSSSIKLKNGTERHIAQLFDDEADEILELAKSLRHHKLFWPEGIEKEYVKEALMRLAHIDFFQAPLRTLFGTSEVPSNEQSGTIASESQAVRAAREILLQDTDQALRSGSLRNELNVRLGQRAWQRVIGRLRTEFPHISRAGAPRKNPITTPDKS